MQLNSFVGKRVVSVSTAENILIIKFEDGSQLYVEAVARDGKPYLVVIK